MIAGFWYWYLTGLFVWGLLDALAALLHWGRR